MKAIAIATRARETVRHLVTWVLVRGALGWRALERKMGTAVKECQDSEKVIPFACS